MKKYGIYLSAFTILLFVSSHFIYVIYNQEALINSDTIWSYSFSRDLITGVSIKNWVFPPQNYFLDIFISFLPSLTGNIVIHSILVSPINILVLLITFSYFLKRKFNFELYISFSILVLATLFTYFFYSFSSYVISNTFNFDFTAPIILKNYFYMQGNHGLSSVMAIILSYYFFFQPQKIERKYILYIGTFIFSLCDFWFIVYFFPILGIFFLINKKKETLYDLCLLLSLSITAVVLTYFLNDSLSKYDMFNRSVNLDRNFLRDITADYSEKILLFVSLYSLPIFAFIFLYSKKKLDNFEKSIFYGCLVSQLFIVLIDQFNPTHIRLSLMVLPTSILLLKTMIISIFKDRPEKAYYISSFFLIVVIFKPFVLNKPESFKFSDEVQCIKKLQFENNKQKYFVITSYWPGKVIFEGTQRTVNFWDYKNLIYNPLWSELHDQNDALILITYQFNIHSFNPALFKMMKEKTIGYRSLCNNKLILLENLDIKIQK